MKNLLLTIFFTVLIPIYSIGYQYERCKAIKPHGKPCHKVATSNGYCGKHNPDALRCPYKYKDGHICYHIAMQGSSHCRKHLNSN